MSDHTTLLAELGFTDLPQEQQDELNADIGEVVFLGAMRRVWDALDYHGQDTLTSLLKESESDPENSEKRTALAAFLDSHVPDFPAYVRAEVEALKRAHNEAMGETL